jgi:hypothetical protein
LFGPVITTTANEIKYTFVTDKFCLRWDTGELQTLMEPD